MIVEVWGMAWSASWGAIPQGLSLPGFIVMADAGYIAGKMRRSNDRKRDDAYLLRIVKAVQAALRERTGLQ